MKNCTSFFILFLDYPLLFRKIRSHQQRWDIIVFRFEKIALFDRHHNCCLLKRRSISIKGNTWSFDHLWYAEFSFDGESFILLDMIFGGCRY